LKGERSLAGHAGGLILCWRSRGERAASEVGYNVRSREKIQRKKKAPAVPVKWRGKSTPKLGEEGGHQAGVTRGYARQPLGSGIGMLSLKEEPEGKKGKGVRDGRGRKKRKGGETGRKEGAATSGEKASKKARLKARFYHRLDGRQERTGHIDLNQKSVAGWYADLSKSPLRFLENQKRYFNQRVKVAWKQPRIMRVQGRG